MARDPRPGILSTGTSLTCALCRESGRIQSFLMTDEKGKAAVLTELSLVAAAVFWGSNYAATKYAATHIPQLPIVACRFAIGGLLLLLVLRLLEPGSRLERKDVLPMVGLGCPSRDGRPDVLHLRRQPDEHREHGSRLRHRPRVGFAAWFLPRAGAPDALGRAGDGALHYWRRRRLPRGAGRGRGREP